MFVMKKMVRAYAIVGAVLFLAAPMYTEAYSHPGGYWYNGVWYANVDYGYPYRYYNYHYANTASAYWYNSAYTYTTYSYPQYYYTYTVPYYHYDNWNVDYDPRFYNDWSYVNARWCYTNGICAGGYRPYAY